jgi:NADH-quinone oxidoreductase E subunit
VTHPTPRTGSPAHEREHAEDYNPVFTGKAMDELQGIFPRYPNKQAALLPALWIVQRERGWISDRNMAEVAEVLGLTPAYVKGVVTFYTMYHQHPVGKNFVQVCTTSPCNICGAEEVVKTLLAQTGAEDAGATSPDGNWTIVEVECLGACGFPTPILVNDDFLENVTPEKVPGIVKKYR